jgi:hypothetical protein
MLIVVAVSVALWGHGLVGKALIAGAGLLWLAAVWATLTPGPKWPSPSLLVLGSILCLLATTWGRVVFAILAALVLISMRHGRPAKVRAPNLTGTTEYGCSGTLVQEFTAGWRSELSWVITDHAGRFELPQVSPGPTHCLMFSRPGTETLRLEVTIAPEAPPLSVRLRTLQ